MPLMCTVCGSFSSYISMSINPIHFQFKVAVIRSYNEGLSQQHISETFGISQVRVLDIVGEVRLISLYLFNEGWTDAMVGNVLCLSVDCVAILRLTLMESISVCGRS